MNKEKINAGIDRMAEEAKETMNLMSDKIDRATRCGNEKAARINRFAGDTRCRTKKFCNIEIFTIPLHSFRATD